MEEKNVKQYSTKCNPVETEVIITFKKMELLENKRTVRITGTCLLHDVIIELSILQIAKVFGTDIIVLRELKDGFGTEDYEWRCHETRESVQEFPKIDVVGKEIESNDVWVDSGNKTDKDVDAKTIMIYGEDLVGWENEGIRIYFPRTIFFQELKDKEFAVFIRPFSVALRIKSA